MKVMKMPEIEALFKHEVHSEEEEEKDHCDY